MSPSWTLSGDRSIHYLVRQLTIAAAIVMTMNDIYEMIQRFQKCFLFLVQQQTWELLIVIHILQVSTLEVRDLSKDMELVWGQIFRCQSPRLLAWNISKHNKSTNSYKKHAGTHPRDYTLASELPSLCTVSLMSQCSLSCTMIYHSEEDQMSPLPGVQN